MKVIRRDPAKGYIDTNFWLPKSFANVEGVKNALTFDFSEKGKPNVLVLWKETPSHLIVPREFWDTTSSDFTFPIVDCRPIAYQRVQIESKIRLDHLPNLQGVLTPTGDDVQRHAMEALLPSRGGILQLACGKGKAQPRSTPIPTTRGWRALGDLQVGDEVFGSDGKPTRVVGVFPQGVLPVYRVTMEDGTSTRCCNEHLWFTQTPGDRRKGLPGQVRSMGLICETLRSAAGAQHAIPRTEPLEYPDAEGVYSPLLIGAYLGDGHSAVYRGARRIQIDKGSAEFHAILAKELNAVGEPYGTATDKRSKNISTFIRFEHGMGDTFWEVLEELGLIGIPSEEKFIPEKYLRASVRERVALLDALLLTDGSIVPTGRTFSTSSPKLRDGVVELARSLGIRVSIEPRQTYYTYRGERRKGRPSWRLYMTHPRWGKGRYEKQYIQSVEPEGWQDCVCIKVEAEDSLYVTEDFILTHNTVVALDFIARKKVPTLIVVDTTQLIEQWLTSINMFLNIPDGVGMMGDGEFRWHHPVVVATYHTLAARAATLPEEIRRWFGMIIWDEAHHVAAPTFARSADLFFGHRFGLTATPDRSDGQHVIYNFHIGRVLFKDLTQKLKPKIFFKWTGLSLDPQDSYVQIETRDKNGELHIGKTAVFFGQWRERLRAVLSEVQLAVSQDRKIIVLSQSVDEAVNLLALWNGRSDNDLYTDVPKPTERDVGETIMPAMLSTESKISLVKKLAELRNLLKDPALNPIKRQTFEEKVKNIRFRLDQDRVSKKIEALRRKKQKAYLKELLAMPSTGGLMIYKVEASARTAMLRSKQVTFAIMKYGKEGLDEPALDTVIVSTPISDRNTLQQIMGRPSREKEGKKGPIVVFLEDNVGPMIGMCVKLRSHLKGWAIEEGGPYSYELIDNPATTNRRQSWSNQLRVSGS